MTSRIVAAALLGAIGTAFVLSLFILGVPVPFLVVVALAFLGTAILSATWHPAAVLASVALYAGAVVLGVVTFSLQGLAIAGL